MYIKIERGDKTQFLQAKAYYTNECGNGLDVNIHTVDGTIHQVRIEEGDMSNVFIMNDEGKTIDRI